MKSLIILFFFFIGSFQLTAQDYKGVRFRSEAPANLAFRDHVAVYEVSNMEYYVIFIEDTYDVNKAKAIGKKIMKDFWLKNKAKDRDQRLEAARSGWESISPFYSSEPDTDSLDMILDKN
jgi:hypothetical protein